MNRDVRVVLAGINGYGRLYLDLLLDDGARHGATLAGVVDPAADRSKHRDVLRARGIPAYPSLQAFYADQRADLAVLATPIPLHRENTVTALAHGSHVLCEKPLCATLAEADAMRAAERAYPDQFVAVGYNMSFSPTIAALKDDIRAGVYGAPVALKCLVSWPRYTNYYDRNDWAGQLQTPRGEWVLDSPLHNATAHFLHNMLYVCGNRTDTAARVRSVEAELYRVNPITGFDTCAVRCRMEDGWTIHFYTTHADEASVGPLSSYVFENGVIYGEPGAGFVGHVGGHRRSYPVDPDLDGLTNKLWRCVARCRGEDTAVCGIAAARETTRVVNAAHVSMSDIVDFPASMTVRKTLDSGLVQRAVPGLLHGLAQCYADARLPSEHGALRYARPGVAVDLADLVHYPNGPVAREPEHVPV